MYKYLLVFLIGFMTVSMMNGCKIVKAVGETVVDTGKLIGIGGSDDDSEQPNKPDGSIIQSEEEPREPSSEETNLLVGTFVVVLVLFLITLGIRYFYFRK